MRTRTPKKYVKWSFLLLPTCKRQTFVIKFHCPTRQISYTRRSYAGHLKQGNQLASENEVLDAQTTTRIDDFYA